MGARSRGDQQGGRGSAAEGHGWREERHTDRQTDDHAEELSQCHSSSPFSRFGAASSTHSSTAAQHNQTPCTRQPLNNTPVEFE